MRGEAVSHARELGEPSHRRDERSAERDMNAFGREYEEDHSWEELEEDEFGNLRPLVGGWAGGGGGRLSKQGGGPLEIGARSRACVACGEAQGPNPIAARCAAPQDRKQEQRARREQLLSLVASARIRRGMIRYLQASRQRSTAQHTQELHG